MIELLSECVSYPWIPEAAGVCHLTGFMRETNKQKAGQQWWITAQKTLRGLLVKSTDLVDYFWSVQSNTSILS